RAFTAGGVAVDARDRHAGKRAIRGFHSPLSAESPAFSSNENLWINNQSDPNESRAQLITLRQSVLKLTGDVLNDDPR
ncbi:hypothetical protein QP721_23100, partial [Citrobacter koseri]|nr:hypothetical protein [Citrobacter koseri]